MPPEARDSQGRKVFPGDWVVVRAGIQTAVGVIVGIPCTDDPPCFVRVRLWAGQHIYCWPHEFGLLYTLWRAKP